MANLYYVLLFSYIGGFVLTRDFVKSLAFPCFYFCLWLWSVSFGDAIIKAIGVVNKSIAEKNHCNKNK